MVVCVTDFGVSKMMTQEMSKAAGTPMYMSPEIINGGAYSFSADTYSFAFIVWELFARKLPYGDMIPWEITKGVCESGLRPEPLNDPIDVLTDRCWAQAPQKRPSFAAILEWYRVGLLVRPATLDANQWELELDFFGIEVRHREELLATDASLGQRLRVKALVAAEAKAEPLLSKLEDLCVAAAEQAAAEGCQVVKCDFLKGHSYLRASAGVDKTCPSKFHTNSVDKAHVAFLRDTTNVTLLLRRLKLRGFDVTLATIGSSAKSFCIHFQLF